jgi:prevent-host-death family protein
MVGCNSRCWTRDGRRRAGGGHGPTALIRGDEQNASAVVAEVAAGETVTITDRGRPVARLVPIGEGSLKELVEAGRARPALRKLSQLGPPPRRASGAVELSRLVDELRADERWSWPSIWTRLLP